MRHWERGSYTLEGTVIVSMLCLMIGLVISLGFYCHDLAVLQSGADELAEYAAMWKGRYVQPEIKEVDYERMKASEKVSIQDFEGMGWSLLEERLLWGRVENIAITESLLSGEVRINIEGRFSIGNRSFSSSAQASAYICPSEKLPRRSKEGGGPDESGEPQG